MSKLELTVFTYGSNERRAEIELRPTIPDAFRNDIHVLDSWVKALSMTTAYDLKHTNAWECAGKPARENLYDMASWIHLPQPRVVIYIHHLCEAGKDTCYHAISVQMRAMIASVTGNIPQRLHSWKSRMVWNIPCLRAVVTIGPTRASILRLRGVVAYVILRAFFSADCQNQDWKRHKKICKTTNRVNWVNWD